MPENDPNQTQECLLIGGPADGRRENVPNHADRMVVHVQDPSARAAYNPKSPGPAAGLPIVSHTYLKVKVPGNRRVLLHEDIPFARMVEALIERYPRPFPAK